jgi:hypothetical protein
MKWITRERVKVDRVACPWLIKKFVDQDAPSSFRSGRQGYGGSETPRRHSVRRERRGARSSRQGMLVRGDSKKYELTKNLALVLLGKIVNGADTDNTLYHQPEGPGLEAIAEGFRHLGYKDDHAVNAAEWIVYDALYAFCQEMVRQGKPNGDFAT